MEVNKFLCVLSRIKVLYIGKNRGYDDDKF